MKHSDLLGGKNAVTIQGVWLSGVLILTGNLFASLLRQTRFQTLAIQQVMAASLPLSREEQRHTGLTMHSKKRQRYNDKRDTGNLSW